MNKANLAQLWERVGWIDLAICVTRIFDRVLKQGEKLENNMCYFDYIIFVCFSKGGGPKENK